MEVKIIVPKFPNGIAIGEERENLAVPVVVDYTAWIEQHGAGALQILLQRPQDADPYPVTVTNDNGEAVWTPNETDMNFKGRGEIQLVYTADDVIERSPVIMVISGRSLVAAGDPPEPYETWLERLTELAAETQQSALDAADSATEAEQSAGAAAGSAGAAAQSALDAEAAKTGAEAAARVAGQSAALAGEKAAQAAESAQTAVENADYSETQRIAAESAAVLAADSVERSEAAADGANQAKTDAQSAASAAAESASAASGSAADAAATVTEVETKGAEQITAINQAGATQIAAVDAAGAAQISAIEDAGEAVLESIPADYTELADDVSDLKSAFDEKILPTANLIDTRKNTLDSYINNNNGAVTTYGNWQASDYIKIEPNTMYLFLSWRSTQWVRPESIYFAFYDAEKKYTHGGVTSSSLRSINSKSNDVYVRVSGANAVMSSNMPMFGKESDLSGLVASTDYSAYIPYGNALDGDVLKSAVSELSQEVENIAESVDSLFDVQSGMFLYAVGTFAQGAPVNSTNRIRSMGRVHPSVREITCNTGYLFTIQAYNKSDGVWAGSLKSGNVFSTSGTTIWVDDFDLLECQKIHPNYYFRVVVKKTNDLDMTVTDAENVKYIIDPLTKSKALIPIVSIPETVSDYYYLFDAFVTDGFATKTELAVVEGLPIYKYDFEGMDKWAEGGANSEHVGDDRLFNKLQILATSGMHGDEKGSPMYLYQFIYNICNNKEYAKYLSLFDFHIVPICNPTGYNANTRNNYQDININRLDESSETVEAQAIMGVIDSQEYDLYIDFHNCETDGSSTKYPGVSGAFSLANATENTQKVKAYRAYMEAGAKTAGVIRDQFCLPESNNVQSFFPWDGTTNQTFRNYGYSHEKSGETVGAKISACFEVSRACWSLTNQLTQWNGYSLIVGTNLLNNVFADFLDKVYSGYFA